MASACCNPDKQAPLQCCVSTGLLKHFMSCLPRACSSSGSMKLAVMDGPLYAHSNGLVFVSRPTKVHVLLLDQVRPCCSGCHQRKVAPLNVCTCAVHVRAACVTCWRCSAICWHLCKSSVLCCQHSPLAALYHPACSLRPVRPKHSPVLDRCFLRCTDRRSRQYGCRTLPAALQATLTSAHASSYAETSPAAACCLRRT